MLALIRCASCNLGSERGGGYASGPAAWSLIACSWSFVPAMPTNSVRLKDLRVLGGPGY
jgi:hypothetical protein